ncbi:hypothetical protein ACFW1A_10640 [Kitasatospora sp. NPDC058965]|uniref:hypothetical protein n=1 Tax=Kitasatospora sp. NPDC058965 TaxID=3346682 RepID=UPI0036B0F60B
MALATTLAATGCSQANKVVSEVAQSPITPIVLKIVHDQLVQLAADSAPVNPTVAAVATLGVFAVDAASSQVAAEQKKNKAAADATYLLITQTIGGKTETSIFKITTSHKLLVAMNGTFVESIEPKKVTITAQPGTDSTIVVTDAQAGQVPYINATVHLRRRSAIHLGSGDYTHADLDTGRDKDLPAPDKNADLQVGDTADLKAVNGAEASRWTSSDAPSQAGCQSLPEGSWTTVLYTVNPGGLGNDVWCVRSKQGRYGVLAGAAASPNYDWNIGYVLWKKPDDR